MGNGNLIWNMINFLSLVKFPHFLNREWEVSNHMDSFILFAFSSLIFHQDKQKTFDMMLSHNAWDPNKTQYLYSGKGQVFPLPLPTILPITTLKGSKEERQSYIWTSKSLVMTYSLSFDFRPNENVELLLSFNFVPNENVKEVDYIYNVKCQKLNIVNYILTSANVWLWKFWN